MTIPVTRDKRERNDACCLAFGHIAIEHEEALRISEALRARGVISDFRPPRIIRIAPSPLYNTYHEVWGVSQHLKSIVESREYERFQRQRKQIS